MIDLRSDTITKPTPGMLDAMMSAQVGDDVFGADPTVNALQDRIAKMFGKEAALFCPSGTMTNQIAIRIQTQPQDEVICDRYAHIYLYEGGGMMYNSFVSPKLLSGERGKITSDQVKNAINPDDIHQPRSVMVSVENTMNKGGGAIYQLEELKRIKQVCLAHNLKFHLDGARLFNALVETEERPLDHGSLFDTISICFSKGLGAPVGSVLLGSNEAIQKAKRVRKVLGGGMRQIGYLAAACLYALDHHIDRLKEDHRRARALGNALAKLTWVPEVLPVETNIVVFKLRDDLNEREVVQLLTQKGILCVAFGKGFVRFVTHLHITDADIDQVIETLKKIHW